MCFGVLICSFYLFRLAVALGNRETPAVTTEGTIAVPARVQTEVLLLIINHSSHSSKGQTSTADQGPNSRQPDR